MTQQPNNISSKENPVGRFMVAVGCVIEHQPSGKILLLQRSNKLDWRPGMWEIGYGRIDQFEDPEEGLRREVREETGITELTIGTVLRVWHMYRGSKAPENDLVGVTYACQTSSEQVSISSEHEGYQWVTPEEALKLVTDPGILDDVQRFIQLKK